MLDYTVKIYSVNGKEIEWEQEITSRTSMTGARRKATNWVKKNLCEGEYSEITKKASEVREYWYIR